MKNTIKFILFFVAILAIVLIVPNISEASTSVNSEETLLSAIRSTEAGGTISLENNITVTQPIVITTELTINGNGYTVAGSTDWTSTSGNQTMFTAQSSGAKLTLKDIDLNNGPKYGVQAYDGGTVILNNVSITGFRYGGVLVNGGNVEIIDLHLAYNGTGANNGIEIDKGSAVTNNPTLTMNGTLTSDTTENVVRIPENSKLTEFTVTNTPNTTNKVIVSGTTIALTDASDNIIAESTMPETVTANTDAPKVIVTLIAGDQTHKIAVDEGQTITADFLKPYITVAENYEIAGFFTNAEYTEEFNFNNPLSADTTIYAKIAEIQNNVPATEIQESKDETPKTGSESYLGIAIITILFSILAIAFLRKGNKRIG